MVQLITEIIQNKWIQLRQCQKKRIAIHDLQTKMTCF